MSLLQLYFSLDGRIGRQTFWLKGVALLVLIAFAVGALIVVTTQGLGLLLFFPVFWWVALAVSVKRWHDRGKSGWWVLIGLVPVIGGWWALIETEFFPGTDGENRFGARAY